jgi:branched-chain amino acid transport system substrate-binding protein
MAGRDTALLAVFRVVGLIAAVGLVAGGLASCGTPAPEVTPEVIKETVVVEQTVVVAATPEPEKEPIRIGMGQPFTGPVAWIGQNINYGFSMAAEEINAAGGIQGHRVEIYPCDNEGQAEKAITCVRKLVDQDNVHMIIGMGSSTCVLAAMPLMEEYQVPFVAENGTDESITSTTGPAGGNIWAFRTCAHEGQMTEALVDYIAEEVNSVSMLAVNTAYGRNTAAKMQELLKERGVEVLSVDYSEEGQPDYRATITRMKSFNPEGLYLALMAKDGALFVRQMGEAGLTAKLFTSDMMAWEFIEGLGEDIGLAEGMTECSTSATGVHTEFEQRFFDRWAVMPHGTGQSAYNTLRYVIPAAIENALAECGDLSHSCIRQGLENVSVDTPLFGHIEFDEYHQAHPDIALMQIEDGEPVLLTFVSTGS